MFECLPGIPSDNSKIQIITDPIRKHCTQVEEELNRLLNKLEQVNHIDEGTYTDLNVSVSAPVLMYELPKIPKSDSTTKFQFRPILAA